MESCNPAKVIRVQCAARGKSMLRYIGLPAIGFAFVSIMSPASTMVGRRRYRHNQPSVASVTAITLTSMWCSK
jgi:hypothetical protein